jgi:hypothetical protein
VCTYAHGVYADLAVSCRRHFLAHMLENVGLMVLKDTPKGIAKYTWNVRKKQKKMFKSSYKPAGSTSLFISWFIGVFPTQK